MGWLFKAGSSRKDLIAENTKGWERTKEDGTTVASVCLAHCYRGGVFSGVLWSVWERTFIKNGQQVEPPQRWNVMPGKRLGKDESDTRLIVVRQIIHPS
jgi:hypothetical protein